MDLDKKKMLQDFISEHMGLIRMHGKVLRSKGMVPKHVDIESGDLDEPGITGLMHAVMHYNDSKATAKDPNPDTNHFANYAGNWIRGKMMEHLGQHDEVPQLLRRKAKVLSQNQQQTQDVSEPEQPSEQTTPTTTPQDRG